MTFLFVTGAKQSKLIFYARKDGKCELSQGDLRYPWEFFYCHKLDILFSQRQYLKQFFVLLTQITILVPLFHQHEY